MIKNYSLILLVTFLLISCTSDYQKGEKEMQLAHYDNALFIFKNIKQSSEDYRNAQFKIVEIYNKKDNASRNLKIDSLDQFTQVAKEEKSSTKTLKEEKQKIQDLFDALMYFKNKRDFHEYGFAVCCQYNKWLTDVGDLKKSPDSDALYDDGYSVITLQSLGLAYLRSKGKETKFTRYARKNFLWGLK